MNLEQAQREIESLQRRVHINAEARLNDYRIALSQALKPLVADLPSNSTDPLLVRIDQIIATLADNGVTLERRSR